jgi:hypothetical protein
MGRLLARPGQAHAFEHRRADLARAHAGLPDDLLNFQHDPAACAVALGWSGAGAEVMHLEPRFDGHVLRFEQVNDGKRNHVVLDIDGADFTDTWLTASDRADSSS